MTRWWNLPGIPAVGRFCLLLRFMYYCWIPPIRVYIIPNNPGGLFTLLPPNGLDEEIGGQFGKKLVKS